MNGNHVFFSSNDSSNNVGFSNNCFYSSNIYFNVPDNSFFPGNDNKDVNELSGNLNCNRYNNGRIGFSDIVKMIIAIFIFVLCCVNVRKLFTLKDEINKFDEPVTKYDSIDDSSSNIYFDNNDLDDNSSLGISFSKYVSCMKSSFSVDNIPDDIKNTIREINDLYSQSGSGFSYKYKDIYSGFTVSINENQVIWGASAIKAPLDIYVYELASQGKVSLDEELLYSPSFYIYGTGVMKNHSPGGKYDIRTLVGYSILYSDNIAHLMLTDRFGRVNVRDYWSEFGSDSLFVANTSWSNFSAHDAVIYMNELYNFYLNNNEYGKELLSYFLNSGTKFMSSKSGYKIASKSGAGASSTVHDVGIVFADNPYILAILTNFSYDDHYHEYFFKRVSDLTEKLHDDYWDYKLSYCKSLYM